MSQPIVHISDETKCACRLTARRVFTDGTDVGHAVSSGFLWRHKDEVYVITNWHCLSGRNPTTLDPVGTFCPNRVLVEGKFDQPSLESPDTALVLNFKHEVAIEDDRGDRLWIEHPKGHLVDVVAFRLRIKESGGYRFRCLNEVSYETRWRPGVGDSAFIIGFPEGVSSAHETPIWKRASIASEPDLNYGDSPVFLVDTIGNKGLSGSPVIASGSGMFLLGSGINDESLIGSWKRFVGIYAGRLGEEGVWSQLGRVWKSEVVDEIFGTIE